MRAAAPQPVFVSTTYDRALERAFADEGEDVDVVSYLAVGRDRGKFLHRPSDGEPRVIDLPNAYADLPLGERPVLLRVHGGVDPNGRLRESFVVSEDDYIGYLSPGEHGRCAPGHARRQAPPQPLPLPRVRRAGVEPAGVPAPCLRRGESAYRSWAVQQERKAGERDFWRHRGIDLFDAPLAPYLDRLLERLEAQPIAEAIA